MPGTANTENMKINTVTVTGADNSVSPRELEEISREFPFVEFGILLSNGQCGSNRFPSMRWLHDLQSLPDTVQLSGHICGAWVREIFEGAWAVGIFLTILGADFFQRFSRWQLNTHGHPHKWNQRFITNLQISRSIIFQYDGENNEVLAAAKAADTCKIAALFDLSHGAGVLPNKWLPPLDGIYCGYAGGMSPENVADQCRAIESVVGDARIWIDAETHLRSDGDRRFDLKKVRAFLRAAAPYVTTEVAP